ncbi:MAG: alpha/beta hydrolase-fold protein [Candidatus Aminicenantes bacterium]|nr:alpha/beta hydrolase-fold protein [Candidatus Aminicenantes bacterium]
MNRKEQLGKALLALLIVPVMATNAAAQARPNLSVARLVYNAAKSQANPQGDLKGQLAVIDKAIAEAMRMGRTGEVRRLLAQGQTLLAGREWTDDLDFSNSLVLRAEAVVLDSKQPGSIRIEHIYAPRLQIVGPLTARVSLHRPRRAALGFQPGDKIKDLATQEGLSGDLLDEPGRIELDWTGIEDGAYVVQAEVFDRDKTLGAASLAVELRGGLADRLRSIEAGLKKIRGFKARLADVLYPVERIRDVNRGKMEIGGFQVAEELSAAESVLAALRSGKDPFDGRKGDMERHYLLEGAGEIMPYRVYVPTKYDGRAAFPLIIALHGLGATEDSFFDSYGKVLPKLAEAHGYLVAAPLGYRLDGFYGVTVPGMAAGGSAQRKLELSEQDVMNVLSLMKRDYAVDASRIYLMGHSMGAMGTWHLGAKYPDIWAALALFSGYGVPSTVAGMKHIPEFIVHGDADLTLPVALSRAMVAELKAQGVEHTYIEVPGGSHVNVVEPNLAAAIEFFDAHRKKAPASSIAK